MKVVYSVDMDLGYDGYYVEALFSTKDKAKQYILDEYPHAKYDKIKNKWILSHLRPMTNEKLWDGDLYITERKVDEE